jgi:hypothetical protein
VTLNHGDVAWKTEDAVYGWTIEPPTENGWYWAQRENGETIVVESRGVAIVRYGNKALPVTDFTHWLGPIPKPESPEGA